MLCLHVCLPRTSLLLSCVVSTPRQGPFLSFSSLLGPSTVPGTSWAQPMLFGLKNERSHEPLSERNYGLNGGESWNWEECGRVRLLSPVTICMRTREGLCVEAPADTGR